MKNTIIGLLMCLWIGQAYGQCNYFEQEIKAGDAHLRENNPDYKEIIRHYSLAMKLCPERGKEAQDKIQDVFKRIEKLRHDAEKAEKEALEQKQLAQTNLDKANKLVNAFYFAYGRFALAYGGEDYQKKFYFIDKNGDRVEKLGAWDKAEQFEENGFAKVKKKEGEKFLDFLLDTLGNYYELAFELNSVKETTKALDLTDWGLDSLPNDLFKYTQLQVLILNRNHLSNLPSQIGELKNLTSLDLSSNQLSSLPSQVGELKNLKKINLRGNHLSNLPSQIWELKNLTNLDLSSNQLSSLPNQIGELKNLTELNLYNNQLSSLPSQIGKLKSLSVLYLSLNHLSNLPSQIGELKNLTSLDLGSNKISSLPSQIGELKNLTSFYIYGNKLTELPSQIGALKNLTNLDLSSNQLSSLPSQIVDLKNLTELNLYNNQLSSLPSQIGKLKNLSVLYLSLNQLTYLPSQIGELKNLSALNLNRNQLTVLNQIGKLKNLISLDLRENSIRDTEIGKIKKLLPTCQIIDESSLEYQFKDRKYTAIVKYHQSHLNDAFSAYELDILSQSYNQEGIRFDDNKETDKAMQYYHQSRKLKPDFYWAWRSLGNKYLNEKKMYDSAFICYTQAYTIQEKAYQIQPDDNETKKKYLDVLSSLAPVQLYVKQFAEAEKNIQKRIALGADDVFLKLQLARAYLFQGKYQQAEAIYHYVKDQKASQTETGRQAALRQLKSMQESGIYHPDVEKIRELLKE